MFKSLAFLAIIFAVCSAQWGYGPMMGGYGPGMMGGYGGYPGMMGPGMMGGYGPMMGPGMYGGYGMPMYRPGLLGMLLG